MFRIGAGTEWIRIGNQKGYVFDESCLWASLRSPPYHPTMPQMMRLTWSALDLEEFCATWSLSSKNSYLAGVMNA